MSFLKARKSTTADAGCGFAAAAWSVVGSPVLCVVGRIQLRPAVTTTWEHVYTRQNSQGSCCSNVPATQWLISDQTKFPAPTKPEVWKCKQCQASVNHCSGNTQCPTSAVCPRLTNNGKAQSPAHWLARPVNLLDNIGPPTAATLHKMCPEPQFLRSIVARMVRTNEAKIEGFEYT